MKATTASLAGLDPLKDLLSDVLSRLEALESTVGKGSDLGASSRGLGSSTRGLDRSSRHSIAQPPKVGSAAAGELPALKAYDAYVKECVIPFTESCDDLEGLGPVGSEIRNAWEGIRSVIVLASRSKAPPEPDFVNEMTPQLKQTHGAVQAIRSMKVGRDFDRHYKAITEMLSSLSWVFYIAPKQLPATFVKETLGSAEFWTNRIRKDFKGKDEQQIEFCDRLKQVLLGLEKYIHEYHKTGLTFNPRGVSIAEASVLLSDQPSDQQDDLLKSPKGKQHPILKMTAGGGLNMTGIMGELNKRKSADGSSAATGLKRVEKTQQTWRKEFKADSGPVKAPPALPVLTQAASKADKKKKPRGIPIFEYQDRGFKWVIENHTKESVIREGSETGILVVAITDPKQQVYIYNCEGVQVKINGKFKSIAVDSCEQCSVAFENLISSTEVVNSKKIKLQVTGICPVFTIDKTVNLLIWLSEESKNISTFTTSLSSELNVSFPDGEDMKELPIPEQFVHKLQNGSLSSDVSDLYH